jgi:Tfp pilus tip-associated adhesin PilY1
MSGVGQTWSTPNVGFIKGYSTTTPVIVVGGGYDSCEDADTPTPSCSGRKGGYVFVLNADTGALLRAFTTDRAVAADVPMVDVNNDGMPDFAFPVDTGGNIYRIDFVNASGGYMPLTADSWTLRKVAYASGGRKFLFAPALFATAGKVYLALGSGDREHPLQSQYPYNNVLNRFYVYLDDLMAPAATPATSLDGLTDYTNSNSCDTAPILPGSTSKGWYMNLNQYGQGEQAVTSAVINGGLAVFSTNRPIPPDAASCSTSLGEARGYWVNLFNGSGGLGGAAACGLARSAVFVGGGIPPSPTKATVNVGGRTVTVVLGATRASGGNGPLPPAYPPPALSYKRKRVYKATSGD